MSPVCLLDQLGDPRRGGGVESGGGFVVQQAVGVGGQRACDRQPLLLTTAEVPGRNRPWHLECLEQVSPVVTEQRLPPPPAVVTGELHVFGGRQFVEEGETLEDDADPPPGCRPCHRVAVDRDPAREPDIVGIVGGQSGQCPQQLGLSGSADTDDQYDAAGRQVDGDISQQCPPPGDQRDALQRQARAPTDSISPSPGGFGGFEGVEIRFGRILSPFFFPRGSWTVPDHRLHRGGPGWVFPGAMAAETSAVWGPKGPAQESQPIRNQPAGLFPDLVPQHQGELGSDSRLGVPISNSAIRRTVVRMRVAGQQFGLWRPSRGLLGLAELRVVDAVRRTISRAGCGARGPGAAWKPLRRPPAGPGGLPPIADHRSTTLTFRWSPGQDGPSLSRTVNSF
ncbi:MAG: hypothetical protein Ct9H300mP1_11680 [Planctomycetaceae bacterium]|nr:MAG: hypothetical protein Ct9H300mP1_11680 [Planctomycetaceae bacterium]